MTDSNTGEPRLWRACPSCACARHAPCLAKGPLQLVRCADCGLCFANPIERACADGSFYDRTAAAYYLSPEKLEGDYAPVRFDRELRIFRRHCRRGAVLDIGCSTGGFLHELGARFPGDYESLGIDVSGPALDYAESRGMRVERTPFLEHDFGRQRFDALTLWAVLEHLAEPRGFVAKVATLLRPGGHCFILVPNQRSLAVRVLGARYRYIMTEHLTYFEAATLRGFLAREPTLELVWLGTTHFNPIVIAQDWRGRAERAMPSERASLLRRTTTWKTTPLLAPLRLAYAAAEHMLRCLQLADNLVAVLRRR